MREYTVREYDTTDIELLDNMSNAEIIETLEHIKRGWMPQNYVFPRDGETYSEDEYDTTKLHVAMRKAIQIISDLAR